MRLYCFTHFMISSMAKGIQSLHSTVEMFSKYEKLDIYDYAMSTGREPPLDLINTSLKADILYNWASKHKTCIVLNGGTSPDLAEIELFFKSTENMYPWASFYEDESLGNLMTSISIVLPEKIYATSSAMRTGVLSFNEQGMLLCVDSSALDPEMIAKLMSFGEFNKWEQSMVMVLNKFKLAQ